MTNDTLRFWWRIGFGVLGGLLIVVALAYLLWARSRHRVATQSWVSTPGMVLWSNLEVAEQALGTIGSVTKTMKLYIPRIEYRYDVGGERRGKTPFLMYKHFSTPAQGEAWLRTVPANAPVEVWYDPADPNRSALTGDKVAYGAIIAVALTGLAVIGAGWLLSPDG